MPVIIATFEVHAGATTETNDWSPLLADSMPAPGELAAMVENSIDLDLTLCHSCSDTVQEPEPGALAGFTVVTDDGVTLEYTQRGGEWVLANR